MIPLITHTPRLTLLAASRALLTAELHKPQYFSVLLGAEVPRNWAAIGPGRAGLETALTTLTAGGRTVAGWHSWYVLLKAAAATPRTLVGLGGFAGLPDAAGAATITFALAPEWRGQGLGTELVAGLVQQAEATGLVRQLLAQVAAANVPAAQALLANGFEPATGETLYFERTVVPTRTENGPVEK